MVIIFALQLLLLLLFLPMKEPVAHYCEIWIIIPKRNLAIEYLSNSYPPNRSIICVLWDL